MEASGSAETLDVIITRAALRTYHTIKRAAVINYTQFIGVKPVLRYTSNTLPSGSVEIRTIIRHTVIISKSILRLTLLALVT